MAIFLVTMATATLILFFDVVFELIEERIWLTYFSCSLVGSFCSLCLFFREIKRKALLGNDDVMVLMTSSNLLHHSMGMPLNYFMSF